MAINGSTLRLTGLSSGFDTDSIIKSLMQIEQLKVDREIRKQTTMQWKYEHLNTVKADLKDFRQTYMSVLSPKNLMSEGAFNTFKAEITGNRSTAVSAVAGGKASVCAYSIKVKQLAMAANATSVNRVSKNYTTLDSSAALKDLNLSQELEFENGEIAFRLTGIVGNEIRSQTFTFKDTDSLDTVIKTVNEAGIGVTMSYSQLTDKISFAASETGKHTFVGVENVKGNAFGDGSNPCAFGITEGGYGNGKNAEAVFITNTGEEIDVERTSNTFEIDGVKYTLNEVTGDETVRVSIKRDVDAAVDKIKEFVDGFNSLIKKLDEMVSIRKTGKETSYIPLTDEEKSAMTEKQIEEWETIAKKGVLYGDAGIKSLINNIRGALYEVVEGAGLSPADIGLGTGNYFEGTKGQISLDVDKLRAALEADPQKVMSIFTDGVNNSEATSGQQGLLTRILSAFNTYSEGSETNSISSLETNLRNIANKISDMNVKMDRKAEQLYLKYAAMETALSKLNSQSDWFSSMMGSMNKK